VLSKSNIDAYLASIRGVETLGDAPRSGWRFAYSMTSKAKAPSEPRHGAQMAR
jgi:hypothetical protein